uniref:Homeobox protein abdominal-B n=1 Tax=Meloidogyne hapla TaxID=6305 RepID=A0A1I8B9Z9_MELHA
MSHADLNAYNMLQPAGYTFNRYRNPHQTASMTATFPAPAVTTAIPSGGLSLHLTVAQNSSANLHNLSSNNWTSGDPSYWQP